MQIEVIICVGINSWSHFKKEIKLYNSYKKIQHKSFINWIWQWSLEYNAKATGNKIKIDKLNS